MRFYFGITDPGTVGGVELIERLNGAKLKLSSTPRREEEDIASGLCVAMGTDLVQLCKVYRLLSVFILVLSRVEI